MKLLLDECVPNVLARDLTGHDVSTVEDAGFKGLKNGRLLRAAAASSFDVLLTVDKSMPSQQNLPAFGIALLLIRARSNRYADLKTVVPQMLKALEKINPGEVIVIRA